MGLVVEMYQLRQTGQCASYRRSRRGDFQKLIKRPGKGGQKGYAAILPLVGPLRYLRRDGERLRQFWRTH